jgi:hypothetical protein
MVRDWRGLAIAGIAALAAIAAYHDRYNDVWSWVLGLALVPWDKIAYACIEGIVDYHTWREERRQAEAAKTSSLILKGEGR